jgi:hypothetical protein
MCDLLHESLPSAVPVNDNGCASARDYEPPGEKGVYEVGAEAGRFGEDFLGDVRRARALDSGVHDLLDDFTTPVVRKLQV